VPNPFATSARIKLFAPIAHDDVDLAVFGVDGRRVTTLFSGALPAGGRSVLWNGRAADGTQAVAGVYFVRLRMGSRIETRRVVHLTD
jgi:hypothetical protein